MKLYGVPLSQPFRSVAWTMLQLRLPFQMEMAVPGMTSKMGTKHDNFRNLTPHRSTQVPIVTYTADDQNQKQKQVALSESPAIMAHLCEKFGSKNSVPILYPPSGSVARAQVDSYLHWHHSNTRLLARLFQVKVRPDLKVTLSEQDHLQLQELLRTLDSGWLNYNDDDSSSSSLKFIGGSDHPTIADILAYGELSTVTMTNLLKVDNDNFPILSGWMNEMAKLPFHDQAHQALVVLGDLSDEGGTPIAKRLGAATKAGIQGLTEAQQSYVG